MSFHFGVELGGVGGCGAVDIATKTTRDENKPLGLP
jgi:hypothetical protein